MKQRISEIVERFKSEGRLLIADEVGSGREPERCRRYREAALDRQTGRIGFRPTGRAIFADEVGSAEWQAAKGGGSKVEFIRTRLEAGENQ